MCNYYLCIHFSKTQMTLYVIINLCLTKITADVGNLQHVHDKYRVLFCYMTLPACLSPFLFGIPLTTRYASPIVSTCNSISTNSLVKYAQSQHKMKILIFSVPLPVVFYLTSCDICKNGRAIA